MAHIVINNNIENELRIKRNKIKIIKEQSQNDDISIQSMKNENKNIQYGIMSFIRNKIDDYSYYEYNILYTCKNFYNLCKYVDKFIIQNIYNSKHLLIYEMKNGNANLVTYNIIVSGNIPYLKINIENYVSGSKYFPFVKIMTPKISFMETNDKKFKKNICNNLTNCVEYNKFVIHINNMHHNDLIELYNNTFNKNKKNIKKNKAKLSIIRHKINILQNV